MRRCGLDVITPLAMVMLLGPWLSTVGMAQSVDEELRSYVEKLDKGQTEEVRQVLPDLITKYQNNPGVTYLHARLTANAIEAVKLFQSIVDNFPKSEWADDALYRIYQYYYSMGLYKTADLKLQQLKRDYPTSEYVTGKKEAKLPSREEVVRIPPKEVPADTTAADSTANSSSKNLSQGSGGTPPVISQPQTGSTPSQPSPKKSAIGKYALQVGAFSSSENASKQRTFLENNGFQVDVTNKVRAGKSLYIVLVGSFADVQEAQKAKQDLRSRFRIDSMIVER